MKEKLKKMIYWIGQLFYPAVIIVAIFMISKEKYLEAILYMSIGFASAFHSTLCEIKKSIDRVMYQIYLLRKDDKRGNENREENSHE